MKKTKGREKRRARRGKSAMTTGKEEGREVSRSRSCPGARNTLSQWASRQDHDAQYVRPRRPRGGARDPSCTRVGSTRARCGSQDRAQCAQRFSSKA